MKSLVIEQINNGYIVSDTSKDIDTALRQKVYYEKLEEMLDDIIDIFMKE